MVRDAWLHPQLDADTFWSLQPEPQTPLHHCSHALILSLPFHYPGILHPSSFKTLGCTFAQHISCDHIQQILLIDELKIVVLHEVRFKTQCCLEWLLARQKGRWCWKGMNIHIFWPIKTPHQNQQIHRVDVVHGGKCEPIIRHGIFVQAVAADC